MPCTRHSAFVEAVHALGGYTLLTVKANQPTLYADLATYFADPHACSQQASTTDYQRGRMAVHRIRVSTEMNAYLSTWPYTPQVAELTRTVTVRSTGKTSQEVVYLLSTVPLELAFPESLLEWVRAIGALKIRCTLCAM